VGDAPTPKGPSAAGTSARSDTRPVIGVTMGDPMGIGPEVIVKALSDRHLRGSARWIIYGMNGFLHMEADRAGVAPEWFRVAHSSARAGQSLDHDCVVMDFDMPDALVHARHEPCKAGGFASKAFVEEAISDAMRPVGDPRRIDAVVTAPISKESWSMAGYRWPGHTELFAFRTRAKRCCMAFVAPKLRVTLATTHLPLMSIRDVLTIGRVFDPIDLGHRLCRDLGIEQPRIAVCGLNPHAGEQGLFGDEETRLIEPAIAMARGSGIDAQGPFPGDTIFRDALAGRFDLVVAMYHDQGLIPVKLVAFDSAVNTTLGLPIVRTSPDHGTAFGIAGQGRADAGAMIEAMRLAVRLARAPRESGAEVHPGHGPAKGEPGAGGLRPWE
jgi:4-hydroxythreonine-4-phosphate dehydrogenase